MRLAPHDSRLGQLQRGRGAGFLAACANPRAARDDLLLCIATDRRLDPRLESRDGYYAELAERVHLDIAPIVQQAGDTEAELAIGVLAELAARHHPEALALIEQPWRRPGVAAAMLEHLRCFPDWAAINLQRPAAEHLAEHLRQRGDLIDDVEIHGEFWQHWRSSLPCVEAAFVDSAAMAAAAAMMAPAPLADPAMLSTVELLDRVGGEDTPRISTELMHRASEGDRALMASCVERLLEAPRRISVAAATLGRLGDLRLLPLAEAMFARADIDRSGADKAFERQRRAALGSYFRALPAEVSLPLARAWWPRGGYLRTAAGSVLEWHAEPCDRVWLEDFVLRMARDSSHAAISEIDALVRIGDPRSLPTLVVVAEQAACSWARLRATRGVALHAGDPGAQAVLVEALWDSEEEARELACRHADLSRSAERDRVAEIVASPLADASTRDAAAARLSA